MQANSIARGRGRYLIFHHLDRTYAVPTRCVEEIVPMAELFSVPGNPSFLAGFLDVGGQPVAVISMRRLLGMPQRERELYTPLVILKALPQQVALEVDGVTRIVEVADDDWMPVADECSLNNFASAIARLEGQTVVLLSLECLLLEQEQRRVIELAELARQRIAESELVTS
jgi:purine-binding chemotaxis protein CheW